MQLLDEVEAKLALRQGRLVCVEPLGHLPPALECSVLHECLDDKGAKLVPRQLDHFFTIQVVSDAIEVWASQVFQCRFQHVTCIPVLGEGQRLGREDLRDLAAELVVLDHGADHVVAEAVLAEVGAAFEDALEHVPSVRVDFRSVVAIRDRIADNLDQDPAATAVARRLHGERLELLADESRRGSAALQDLLYHVVAVHVLRQLSHPAVEVLGKLRLLTRGALLEHDLDTVAAALAQGQGVRLGEGLALALLVGLEVPVVGLLAEFLEAQRLLRRFLLASLTSGLVAERPLGAHAADASAGAGAGAHRSPPAVPPLHRRATAAVGVELELGKVGDLLLGAVEAGEAGPRGLHLQQKVVRLRVIRHQHVDVRTETACRVSLRRMQLCSGSLRMRTHLELMFGSAPAKELCARWFV
mmetsp:Transcript_67895/g.182811  ORF Transcript_67895/g.182811 Transcript_67895/m.182811 type:complete len:414 (+) Transcript_67895:477-1718(+)